MRLLRFVLSVVLLPVLAGCPPEEEEDPGPPPTYSYAEEGDTTNEQPFNPEDIDTDWDPTLNRELTVTGELTDGEASSPREACGWDQSEDWPWTGDNDNFQLTMPADGLLTATLEWDGGEGDIDLLIWTPPLGNPANPDEQFSGTGTPETWLFDDQSFDEGDQQIFTIACASGAGGAYKLTIQWED